MAAFVPPPASTPVNLPANAVALTDAEKASKLRLRSNIRITALMVTAASGKERVVQLRCQPHPVEAGCGVGDGADVQIIGCTDSAAGEDDVRADISILNPFHGVHCAR